eukprot:13539483-Ditylum_brightwellii.AAC.1
MLLMSEEDEVVTKNEFVDAFQITTICRVAEDDNNNGNKDSYNGDSTNVIMPPLKPGYSSSSDLECSLPALMTRTDTSNDDDSSNNNTVNPQECEEEGVLSFKDFKYDWVRKGYKDNDEGSRNEADDEDEGTTQLQLDR